MANPKDIGIRIAQLRTNSGMRVRHAAEAIERGANVWYDWESGGKYPSYLMLIRIADLFGVTLDFLAGREPEQQ